MIVNSTAGLGAMAASAPPAIESAERARQREIATYLSAASFPPGMPTDFISPPILNADPTLNALVQLGALRLGCDRSFLSLIDRQYQFVVAEMTKTHALGEIRSDPDDNIFVGVCKLDACWGICPKTMLAFMDETGEWIQTGPNIIANRTRYIINDFRKDPIYMDRPYVTGYPHMVSYLEVPVISPLGYVLGSYCVIDNKLRDYDNDETVGIMNDIAATIMAHLELMKMKQIRHRSEQLIEGLSGFIGYDPPSPTTALEIKQSTYGTVYATTEARSGLGRSASSVVLDGNGSPVDTLLPQYSQSISNRFSESSQESSVSASSPFPRSSNETPPTTPRDDVGEDPMEQQVVAGDAVVHADAPPPSPPMRAFDVPEMHANGFISSADIKSNFFRAAATIRRAMNMDGLMFLDAVPSSYTDRSDQLALDSSRDSTTDEAVGPFCAAIVQSAVDQSGETTSQSSQTRLPEAVLQRFIRRFPRGHVFSADEFGPIDEKFGPGKPFLVGCKTEEDSHRLRNDVATLFRVLPAAKYIIFLPLWHFQRECWYAAALGWVADPTRAIDIADISLVSAFGNSVMAEVSRLEALAASRAKSNFVSSISHELRSPLHGILASSELLREGISDRSLLSTLDMLDSCGTTLLDTFNNLLDHAIVINDGKGSKTPMTDLQVTDLGRLVEDVVETVKVGQLSEKAFDRKGVYSAELSSAGSNLPDRPPLVILNIGKTSSWNLPISIGAWKRIVMNLSSNALKYTSSGRVEISLRLVQKTDRGGKLGDYISFSVEDTGGGISSDYLKYQLFTPFSQENDHSLGMGLGLSIVQQLTRGLGGTVEVKSSVGVGTRVEILVPISGDASGLTADTEPATVNELQSSDGHLHQLVGQTACLITPTAYAAAVSTSLEITSEMRSRSTIVERALKINAGEALGMKVILSTADCPVPAADLYILDGSLFDEGSGGLESLMPTQYLQVSPLVLLCSEAGSPPCLKQEATQSNCIHLHQPIGPRKLASVFSSALNNDFQAAGYNSRPALRKLGAAVPESRGTLQHITTLPSREKEAEIFEVQDGDQPHTDPQTLPEETTEAASQTKPLHLLLVDDNPINIKLLTAVVRKLNHTFATASNGLEAVQLYKRSLDQELPFDMVFMDISMPVMDGFKATREIRQLETNAGVRRCRIMALTGLSSELSRNEAHASGCDLFITKPVKLDRVRRLLDEGTGVRN